MEEIGVRELKTHASEILRKVREERARYVVTYRGEPIGVLAPLDEDGKPPKEMRPDPWEELERLREQMGRLPKPEKSLMDVLSEMRR
ncbi:MAG: type II toxin-antitoxin system Phd/YefM family antitoxin [Caldilineaceae bacterium]